MELNQLSRPVGERSLYLGAGQSLDELPLVLERIGKHYVVLVVADTTQQQGASLVDVAGRILESGASYVCCWGPDCKRLHDCFDEAAIERNAAVDEPDVVMTTWHDDETLEDAIWFALNSAIPTAHFEATTHSVVVAIVANASWHRVAQEYLLAGAPLRE